jgi:hypothetical protein
MTPDDRLDRLAQVDVFGFVGGTAGLDQGSQNRPLLISQDELLGFFNHSSNLGRNSRPNRA